MSNAQPADCRFGYMKSTLYLRLAWVSDDVVYARSSIGVIYTAARLGGLARMGRGSVVAQMVGGVLRVSRTTVVESIPLSSKNVVAAGNIVKVMMWYMPKTGDIRRARDDGIMVNIGVVV